MMICDRDCFNCPYDDCKLPLNDVDGSEKEMSRELDQKAIYDNSDNDGQKKIDRETHYKEYRREYMRSYMNARNHGKGKVREVRVKVSCFTRDGNKIATFESATMAAKMIGGYAGGVIGCCKNYRPTYKGYQWRYAE